MQSLDQLLKEVRGKLGAVVALSEVAGFTLIGRYLAPTLNYMWALTTAGVVVFCCMGYMALDASFKDPKSDRRFWMATFAVLGLLSVLAYVFLLQYVHSNPSWDERTIGGYEYSATAAKLKEHKPSLTDGDLLQLLEREATRVWSEGSIAAVSFALKVAWTLCTILISLFVASFVFFERSGLPSKEKT